MNIIICNFIYMFTFLESCIYLKDFIKNFQIFINM